MNTQLSLLLFLVFTFNSFAQEPKSSKQPWFYTIGYRAPLVNSKIISSGHGLYAEVGLNAAKFLQTKSIIGIYGGWAFRDLLWSTSFSPGFSKDYKSSIKNTEPSSSSADSSLITLSSELFQQANGRSVPGCGTKSFNNYSLYAGIAIKLPYRWFPITKIYTGTTRSHYYGNATNGGDYTILQLRRKMYGAEILVLSRFCKKNYLDKLQLSVYTEVYNFTNAELFFDNGDVKRSMELKKYTSTSFLKKYNNDLATGIKLSFSVL